MRYSNKFYFVTPVELVAVAEIPPECGLVEAGFATFEKKMEKTDRPSRRILQLRSRNQRILHDYSTCTMARHSRTDMATRRRHAAEPAPTVI